MTGGDALEDLLAEALGDFQAPDTSTSTGIGVDVNAAPANAASATPAPDSTAPVAPVQPSEAPVISQQAQASVSGVSGKPVPPAGLGAKLPARGVRSSAPPTTAASRPVDDASTANVKPAAPPQLPPNIQQLSDELMQLMKEAGLGDEADEATGGDDAAAGLLSSDDALLQSLMAQLQGAMLPGDMAGLDAGFLGSAGGGTKTANAGGAGEGLGAGLPGTGVTQPASGAGSGRGGVQGGPEEAEDLAEGVQSETIRQLLQKTRSTVAQQSKFTRGEGQARATAQASGSSGGAGAMGGLPFGDLLGSLGGLAGLGAGGEGPDGTNMVVHFILQNLLSKDVLYAPLKEIREKYPPWLEAQASSLTPEEHDRYTAQLASIQAVCTQYETAPGDMTRLMELIQEMQKHGDPPAAIVEDIGASIAADLDTGSNQGPSSGAAAPLDPDVDPADLSNMELPPELLKGLPQDLQKECVIM